ncbi:MAG: T9SS type A sorting domain-containing protein [Bacteroidales bacterium]|nr:T9SS type A sorting domain-containing protein [Bacteroidales bacterium]
MKRVSLLLSAFLMVGMLFSTQVMGQGRIDLNGARSAQQCLNATNEGFTATFSFSSIEAAEVATERGVFSYITMDGTYPAGNIGDPTLPAANKLVAVPIGVNNVSVEVKNYSTTVYSLADYGIHNLYPQQTPLRKDQKPEDVPFEYNAKAYTTAGFVEHPIANFHIQGTMRGIQIGALTINPVQYDAVNNTIRVYNNIEVEVNYGQYDKAAAYNEFARTFNPYWAGVYKTMFNERQLRDVYDEHPDLWQNPVKMLVITNRAFESTIQEWVNWKTEKGFYVDVNYTDQIGTNAAAIKTFIQQKYNEDAPTFLMIIGDRNMVPESGTGSETNCVTDLNYSSVDGDMFCDMYHSRFPAEDQSQLIPMLAKALEYEQYTMPDPSYLSKVLLIAGEDSSGWGVQVGRPTIWYATNYYFNEEHGFTEVNEFSHGTYTNCYSYLSSGVGFANYTAHGSQTSWAGPTFNVSDVNTLTNEHKYFLAMGNCCQAADWGYSSTCFGEAMVRAENKGAYAYIGSCPSTYWKNDYYFGVGATNQANGQMPDISITTMGFYDAMWTDDAYNTVTSLMFIGNLASNAAEELGYEIHISNLYDWQAYHTLGDGSIMPFRIQPTPNDVSHLPTLPIGMDFYTVTAAPGSYVGISKDGVLYGAGMVDETGTTDIAITPVTSGGDAKIVVTHPQHEPYVATVPAAAMTGAYVAVDAYALNAEQANYGETLDMNIDVKNVGADASGALTAVLSTDCEYVEILAAEGSTSALQPDEIGTMEGFQFSVAADVPDNTKAQFYLDVTDGTDTWQGKFSIILHAPVVALSAIQNTGEALIIDFVNNGSAPFYGGTFNIYSSSSDLVFAEPTVTIDDVVEANGTVTFNCEYTVASTVPLGTTFEVAYDFTSGMQIVEEDYVLNYGNIMEDFESGQFGEGWTFSQQYAWAIINGGRGNFCAKSMNEGVNSSEGYCELTVNVQAAGELTFWYKVSSETNYDKLFFYMDNIEKGVWSGTAMTGFEQFTQPVTVGTHTFKWLYHKDSSVSSGSDCAWIDDIKFPPVAVIGFTDPVTDLEAVVTGMTVNLSWTAATNADSYIIKRDDETIATVTETTFSEYVDEGVYKYSVFAEKGGAISKPVSVIVTVEYDATGEAQENIISVYPNPANSTLNIVAGGNFEYQLFNGMGQEMASGTANGIQQINVSNMAKGVYFLRLTTGTQVNTQKIVIE